MSVHCPFCRREFDLVDDPREVAIYAEVERLREFCAVAHIAIYPDDTISEQALAQLIGRTPRTLREWRNAPEPQIPHIQIGKSPRYALRDVAAYRKACRAQ